MDKDQIRQIIREELADLLASDRFTFKKHAQFFDGRNIQLGRTTGTQIGTAPDQKLGVFGATPVAQHSSTGETNGFTAGAGVAAKVDSTHTGSIGTKAYTVSDIVAALKELGILKTS